MMTRLTPSDLAHRLGQEAEAVCRHYLNAGSRLGNYWQVGDARNTPGRSMFVRLRETVKGPAGKWTDAATGEYGDLLDVIRESCGLIHFGDVAGEALAFLSMRRPDRSPAPAKRPGKPAPSGSAEAARRLFAMSHPIGGTLVETYLRNRGIAALRGNGNLRFHPRCYYRSDDHSPLETWPAMIAAVTDLNGAITGVHRTWLSSDGFDDVQLGKAPIKTQRKAMGNLLGHAVRFGVPGDVMAAGEGIETVLSARQAIPGMAMAAALSAAHLSAILFPETLRCLYIVRDNDHAGDSARDSLVERANAAGIATIVLSPVLQDFNEDLRHLGEDAVRANLKGKLTPQDVARFLSLAA